MNKFKNIFYIGLLTLFMVSCGDSFLNHNPKEDVDAELAIVDVNTMEYALYGVYDRLQNADYYNRTVVLIPDLISDNVYLSSRTRVWYKDLENFSANSFDNIAEDTWVRIYQTVVNSGLIIKEGNQLEVAASNQGKLNSMLGEAYALRALANFDLTRLYAQPYNFTTNASHYGIPLINNPSVNINEVSYPDRSSVKEVYDAIIDDLENAVGLLSTEAPGESSSYKGRITLNAAKALLSRVYLYQGDWERSEALATEVIDSNQYSLLDRNDLVNNFGNEHNAESIFEIVNTNTNNSSSNSVGYYYHQLGYGDALPSQELYDAYSAQDVRRDFMYIGNRSQSGDVNVPIVDDSKYGRKQGNFEQNISVIRLAEVYLNRAEARAKQATPTKEAEAIDDLKIVAERAELSVVIDPTLSGQNLIDRILDERRKELAFEGHRLFDLNRNKKGFNKYYTGGKSTFISYPNNGNVFPIPASELDANENLQGQQNPGY